MKKLLLIAGLMIFSMSVYAENTTTQESSYKDMVAVEYNLNVQDLGDKMTISWTQPSINGESFKRYKLCMDQTSDHSYPNCQAIYIGDNVSVQSYTIKKPYKDTYVKLCTVTHEMWVYCSEAVMISATAKAEYTYKPQQESPITINLSSSLKNKLDMFVSSYIEKMTWSTEEKIVKMNTISKTLSSLAQSKPAIKDIAMHLVKRMNEEVALIEIMEIFE